MAAAGAKVVISSRKEDACMHAAMDINEKYGNKTALPVPASISSKEDLQKLVTTSNAQLGAIDILVCNAATCPYFGPMSGISDDAFRKILTNNIISNNWLIGMVAPRMIEKRDGSVIIISSVGGMRGSPVIGAYNISKAADMQMARNLAVEYGKYNVRVNCISPGLIKTDFSKALWENPNSLNHTLKSTPLNRIGSSEEVAGAAVFLASKAGSYITGQNIVIDGGMTIAGFE
jgi:NAD(P)-dependent dehydrogenase (short-subunit alcohol dehydrogenase family)